MPIISGRDTICQAQSGTGKTATLSMCGLQRVDTNVRDIQVLVLSPTRELAIQIQRVMLALGDFMSIQVHCCIGGTSVAEDMSKLDAGVHIVTGTPGRVFGLYSRIYSIIMVMNLLIFKFVFFF